MNQCIHMTKWSKEELRVMKTEKNEKVGRKNKTKQEEDMNKREGERMCGGNWWNCDCLLLANGWPAGLSENDGQQRSSLSICFSSPHYYYRESPMKTIADVPLSEHWANQYKFCNILIIWNSKCTIILKVYLTRLASVVCIRVSTFSVSIAISNSHFK